jgi:hypothetical protein
MIGNNITTWFYNDIVLKNRSMIKWKKNQHQLTDGNR